MDTKDRIALRGLRLAFHSVFGNEQRRYEARHALLAGIARRSGFMLYNRHLSWLNDAEYRRASRAFPAVDSVAEERRFNLYYVAKSIRSISGDLAECGVFRGGGSHMMLSATSGTDKHLFGFDSFDGLSEPGTVDLPLDARTLKWKKHDLRSDLTAAQHNLRAHAGRLTLLPGWIPERFDAVRECTFSLVHIDVDLHDPTLASLEFFYPRMGRGGIIVCDDYGSDSCPGARTAMDTFFAGRPEAIIHLTAGQGVVICQAAGPQETAAAAPVIVRGACD
jgi:hypothetical protein